MKPLAKAHFPVLGCFSVLLTLSGCGGAELECDSPQARNSVVKTIADDRNNALVNYAAKNSNAVAAMMAHANGQADKSTILETAKRGAVYKLDETIVLKSRDLRRNIGRDRRGYDGRKRGGFHRKTDDRRPHSGFCRSVPVLRRHTFESGVVCKDEPVCAFHPRTGPRNPLKSNASLFAIRPFAKLTIGRYFNRWKQAAKLRRLTRLPRDGGALTQT
jgi:hypothetical protein